MSTATLDYAPVSQRRIIVLTIRQGEVSGARQNLLMPLEGLRITPAGNGTRRVHIGLGAPLGDDATAKAIANSAYVDSEVRGAELTVILPRHLQDQVVTLTIMIGRDN